MPITPSSAKCERDSAILGPLEFTSINVSCDDDHSEQKKLRVCGKRGEVVGVACDGVRLRLGYILDIDNPKPITAASDVTT